MMSTRIQIHQIIGRQWLADYPDFKTGSGFFINTNQCHIQMGAGIYSMSDGAITRYFQARMEWLVWMHWDLIAKM